VNSVLNLQVPLNAGKLSNGLTIDGSRAMLRSRELDFEPVVDFPGALFRKLTMCPT
jgi:hypothetical protein